MGGGTDISGNNARTGARGKWLAVVAAILAVCFTGIYVMDVAALARFVASRSSAEAIHPRGMKMNLTWLGPRCEANVDHKPAMSERERRTMLKYVEGRFPGSTWRPGEAEYLEWGSGGSTSTYGTAARRVYSVEHAVGLDGANLGRTLETHVVNTRVH